MNKTLRREQKLAISRGIEKLTEEYQTNDTLIHALRNPKYTPMFKMLSIAIKELILRGGECPITEKDVIDLLIEHNKAAYRCINELNKRLEESQEEKLK